MSLSVSVNGGDRVPATDVVLYDENVPIAAAMNHGNIVIYADSARDVSDLASILDNLGVKGTPARLAKINIKGNMGS